MATDGAQDPARILMTGVSGFVGGYLLAACRARYPQATIYGLVQRAGESTRTAAPGDLRLLTADIVDADQVRAVVAEARPDLVFHLAAQASVARSWDDPAQTLAINVGGTVRLLDAIRAEALRPRILLIGSGEQYGAVPPAENPIRETQPFRPVNPYAVSKAAQDLMGYAYYAGHHLPIVRVRSFNSFGAGQDAAFVISSFARQIAQIEATSDPSAAVLLVGNLDAQRDFLPVEDVVRAYLALAERGQPGEAYNVGSGRARSIREILDALLAQARIPVQVQLDPTRLRPADAPLLVADTSLLRAHTGWQPTTSFDDALARTLAYWRDRIAAEAATQH